MDYSVDGSRKRTSVNIQPMDMRAIIHRELEKERIREAIITYELQRRRILEAEVRRELNIQHEMTSALVLRPPLTSYGYRFEPEMMWLGEPVSYASRRVSMPLTERCHDVSGSESVPLQWRPPSPKIKMLTVNQSKSVSNSNEIIGLGLPSGSKRKASATSPPAKKEEDLSCGVCQIVVTSARHLKEHLSGKKHLAKVAPMSKKIKKKPTKKKKKKKKHKKKRVN